MKYVISDIYKISTENGVTIQNGSFLSLLNGDLMFAYIEKYENGASIITLTTSDSGENWSEPHILYHSDSQLDGLSVIRMQATTERASVSEARSARTIFITVISFCRMTAL